MSGHSSNNPKLCLSKFCMVSGKAVCCCWRGLWGKGEDHPPPPPLARQRQRKRFLHWTVARCSPLLVHRSLRDPSPSSSQAMGHLFVEQPPVDLNKALEDTACHIPIVFILSTGVDPAAALVKFASTKCVLWRLGGGGAGRLSGALAMGEVEAMSDVAFALICFFSAGTPMPYNAMR